MLDTIADIRSRLGTCRQRDADTATLLGIVDSYADQLKEEQANVQQVVSFLKQSEENLQQAQMAEAHAGHDLMQLRAANAELRGALDDMRRQYEAYVKNNCKLIRHSVVDGIGNPEDIEGKCGGYAQNYDEPHETCQNCIAAYDPETELAPPGPVSELVEAARKDTKCGRNNYRGMDCPEEGCRARNTCIALAAMDAKVVGK